MPTTRDAFEAGIDAVIADNTLSRGGFADAIRTVLTADFSNAEATAWVDAIAVEYNRLTIINNPTYNNLRGHIIAVTKDPALALWDAIQGTINGLAESAPAVRSAQLLELRELRDNADAALTRMDVLIAAEPAGSVGRLVKDQLRIGKQNLRDLKQNARDAIQALTGDPDG